MKAVEMMLDVLVGDFVAPHLKAAFEGWCEATRDDTHRISARSDISQLEGSHGAALDRTRESFGT
jgi:hypothetical protein